METKPHHIFLDKANSNIETRDAPEILFGDDILKQLDFLQHVNFGKHPNNVDHKRKRTPE